jgi:hypothetical protein
MLLVRFVLIIEEEANAKIVKVDIFVSMIELEANVKIVKVDIFVNIINIKANAKIVIIGIVNIAKKITAPKATYTDILESTTLTFKRLKIKETIFFFIYARIKRNGSFQ